MIAEITVGCFVRTAGGGHGRVVDRKGGQGDGVWWLVKLYTDKDGLIWCRAAHLTVVDR